MSEKVNVEYDPRVTGLNEIVAVIRVKFCTAMTETRLKVSGMACSALPIG